MHHCSKYQIPDFQLHELIRAHYGYTMTPAPGDSYYCTCPMHNHSTPGPNGAFRVYEYNGSESTPRHGGYTCPRGVSGNAWTFLHEVLGYPLPSDANFDETIEFVCEELNITPELRDGYERGPADEAYDLMRDIKDALQPIRFQSPNKHYRKEEGTWLYRGIEPMTWLKYGVGMLGEIDLFDLMDRHDDTAFEAAGISHWDGGIGYEWLAQGVILLRMSVSGTPKGLAVRRYREFTGDDPTPKYAKNNRHSEILNTRYYVYGMDALRDDDSPELFLVEGEFDALALRIRGLPNVVTFGSGQPTNDQMDVLHDTGRHLVFVADADANHAGFQHVAKIAEKAGDAEFIVLPGEDADPDEFVQAQGLDALLGLERYTARQIRMLAEPAYDWSRGQWAEHVDALTKKYLDDIIDYPTAFDELDIEFLAAVSGFREDYLRSTLFAERNCVAAQEHDQPLLLDMYA